MVVEFNTEAGTWVGNFQPGLGQLQFAGTHTNMLDMVVIAGGDLWIVNPRERTAIRMLPSLEAILEVHNPEGWVFNRQDIALARLGPNGLMWHTRRLSWDGFDQLRIIQTEISGLAWSPIDDQWHPFTVDLNTGKSTGGSYSDDDAEGWETLAS
jgi:hypothetical protein